MINNNELHQKIQTETYRIICESITEEECQEMNLPPEEIMPTIKFFKQVQASLINRFFQNKSLEVEYIYKDFDFKTKNHFIVPELLHVNKKFLTYLCQDSGIEFYHFEDRYHFEIAKPKLYEDIKKKYHM